MALDPCDPDSCVPGNMSDQYFYQFAAVLLKGIYSNTSGGGIILSENIAQWGGVATSLGQKVMASSVPVVLASNQSSIPVAATLSAETTKVIGTVNQGTSPWVISGSVTPGTSAATYAAAVVAGAAGAVPTTGVNVLTNAANARIITIFNTLDVDILISPDAGTTYPYFAPKTNGTCTIDLGSNGRHTASNIFAKALVGNSSSGTLYVGLTI